MKTEKNGGAPYTEENINNINLQIDGITDEMQEYLNDIDTFEYNIKEYVYLNGLVQADTATITNYNVENGTTMNMVIELNDDKNTILNVVINLSDNTYDIS